MFYWERRRKTTWEKYAHSERLPFEAVFIGKEQCLEAGKDETASSVHPQQSQHSRIEIHGLIVHRLSNSINLAEVGKCKFVNQAESHSRMLQHVIEVKVLDLVFRGVNFVIAVFEVRLDDERRGIASFRCRCMIATSISATLSISLCRIQHSQS